MSRFLFQPIAGEAVTACWVRVCRAIVPTPAVAFGPEYEEPRPRDGDHYTLIVDTQALTNGRACGDDGVGLLWVQCPSATTRAFGFGLFPEYRGYGLGPLVRDAIYDYIFADSAVWKIESEVYSSNPRSLGALHGATARSREEGRQRQTVRIHGVFYDAILYGITREEWHAVG